MKISLKKYKELEEGEICISTNDLKALINVYGYTTINDLFRTNNLNINMEDIK